MRVSLQDLKEYRQSAFDGAWNGKPGELNAVVGIVDDPVNQRQFELTINVAAEGHILICSSGAGGKTSFLQTILYSLVTAYSPSQLNLYIADCGSRTLGVFNALPHVGGVFFADETDKSDKLISLLIKELNDRELIFSKKGVGSIRDYTRLYNDMPLIIFAIDNFATYYENNQKHEDDLIMLSRKAASYGIYLVVTCGNSSDVRLKIRQNFTYGIGIQLPDKFEYENIIGGRTDLVAEEKIPGRGLVRLGKPLEFQAALCFDEPDSLSVNKKIKEKFDVIASRWTGKKAPVIPQVPRDLSLDTLLNDGNFTQVMHTGRYMPFGYDVEKATVEYIDLAKVFCYTISGTARTGKTNLLKVFARIAGEEGGAAYIFDGPMRTLKYFAEDIKADGYITDTDGLFNLMENTIIPEFTARNVKKGEFSRDEHRDLNKYLASARKIFIFINDMEAFCDAVYNSERDMRGFMELMSVQGDGHMIYFFACVSPADMTGEYGAKLFLRNFVGWKEGVHLGGSLENQRVFDFEAPLMERGRKLPVGYGHTVFDGVTKKIVAAICE